MKNKKNQIKSDLLNIPGVGKSISRDLREVGIKKISDLKEKNPDELYRKLCSIRNAKIDRCVLYVFRCAVYFASNQQHQPKLLRWWNWKDDR
ncbi:MAG: helix-hairpin-helix domain-containing protein [bacterium]